MGRTDRLLSFGHRRRAVVGAIAATALVLVAIGTGSAGAARGSQPTFERLFPLAPAEGVFAYARISPDGRTLAYASEAADRMARGGIQRTVTVVDLKTRAVIFRESGIDAYWSNDGRRMIFRSSQDGLDRVTIRHHDTGAIVRDVAPPQLGDYYSWGVRDGRDLVLTINSHYYFVEGDKGVLPAQTVPACRGIGVGARPLLSKDGRRITTFVRGKIVVRNLTDCEDIVDTGIGGAKADFSWDGRYIAFHMPKGDLSGYEIAVVDLQRRTIRTVTSLPGSSLFPSWTRDGRLSFRYDGNDFRGFMMADAVLAAPERPWGAPIALPARIGWRDVFPETPPPAHHVNVVTVWATWSAHSPDALLDLQQAERALAVSGADVGVFTATDLGSRRADIDRLIARYRIGLPAIRLAPDRLTLTEAHNQVPSTLLFRDGQLVDRRLGAQTTEQLEEWIAGALSAGDRLGAPLPTVP
jgi:hypothetical protein